jgi:hypothetical protein
MRKEAFEKNLRGRLARAGVALGSLTVGRNAAGRLWIFGARLPWGGHITFHAPVTDAAELTGAEVAEDVSRRVEAWLARSAVARPAAAGEARPR